MGKERSASLANEGEARRKPSEKRRGGETIRATAKGYEEDGNLAVKKDRLNIQPSGRRRRRRGEGKIHTRE